MIWFSLIVLITGGAGFIGYHTAVKLAKDPNFKIVVLDVFDDTYDVQLKKSRAATLKEKGKCKKEVQYVSVVQGYCSGVCTHNNFL